MTDADRIVLEDIILQYAFGRIGGVTRKLASGHDKWSQEALECVKQTIDAIERNFNLYRVPAVKFNTPSGTIEIG